MTNLTWCFFASPGRVLLKTWWADRLSQQEGECAKKSISVQLRRSHQSIDSRYCCKFLTKLDILATLFRGYYNLRYYIVREKVVTFCVGKLLHFALIILLHFALM